MKKIFILLFFLLYATFVFAGSAVEEDRAVIFSKEFMDKNLPLPSPYSYWSPSFDQIKQIDVLEYLSKNGFLKDLEDINNYAFQYFGMLVNGKKRICIQAVCINHGEKNWKSELFNVRGGV